MTEQDETYLREIHAGLAMLGLLVRGVPALNIPTLAYEIADGMTQARYPSEGGISSIKRRYAKREKLNETES